MSHKSKTPADARTAILARIREAAAAAGVRRTVPMPAYEGRNGLPEALPDRASRTSAFARRMEELRVSFVLCDSMADVAEGLCTLGIRLKWKNLAIQSSPRLQELIKGLDHGLTRVTADAGKAALGGCDAGIVEALAMDGQTGAILIGGESGAGEVGATVTTLVVIGTGDRISGSLDEAFRMARSKGSLPASLTLITGGATCFGIERRAIPKGNGPTNIIVYLSLVE